ASGRRWRKSSFISTEVDVDLTKGSRAHARFTERRRRHTYVSCCARAAKRSRAHHMVATRASIIRISEGRNKDIRHNAVYGHDGSRATDGNSVGRDDVHGATANLATAAEDDL